MQANFLFAKDFRGVSKDSILIYIRSHQFENADHDISVALMSTDLSETERRIYKELSYYSKLSKEYGFYKGKSSISRIIFKKSQDPYLNSLLNLNSGLHALLYEFDSEKDAYNHLLDAEDDAKKTNNKPLLCEVYKALLTFYIKQIQISNQDYQFFVKQYQKNTYDSTENEIAMLYAFYLKLKTQEKFTKQEIEDVIKISKNNNIEFYRLLAKKLLAAYYDVKEKNYSKSAQYYQEVIDKMKNMTDGVDVNQRNNTLLGYVYSLGTKGKYQLAIQTLLSLDDTYSGKQAKLNLVYKYADLGENYAKLGDYKKAYYNMAKFDEEKVKFEQNANNLKIIQLNSQKKEKDIEHKELEIGRIKKNNYILAGATLLSLLIFGYYYLNKKRIDALNKKVIAEKEKATFAEYQNQLLQKELEKQKIIEKERQRISHDMHDDLGAGISALKLQAEFMKQKVGENNGLKNDIEDLLKTSEVMNVSMREMLWSLNANNDTILNFVKYSTSYAENFFKNSKIKLEVENAVLGDKELKSETRRNLFLCLKEALNNAYKHSQAKSMDLIFALRDNVFSIEIIDDGIGFSEEHNKGNGIHNMRKRMEDIGGNFEIQQPEKGTAIKFYLSI